MNYYNPPVLRKNEIKFQDNDENDGWNPSLIGQYKDGRTIVKVKRVSDF